MNNIEGGSLNESKEDAYTPTIATNWDNPIPTTVQEALNRLAAIVSNNGISPIP